MKIKSILKLTAIAFLGGTMLTSCSSPAAKVENAEVALSEAEIKLAEANAAYYADLENHRIQTRVAVEENKLLIAEYNASLATQKKEMQAANKAKIDALEMKNAELEAKMDAYDADEMSNWDNFKIGFKREMDELGAALKNLTSKDKK